MSRVKVLLRHRFAALVDDEYRRVTNDNVVLRTQVRRYEAALAAATADLQEETAARIKAEGQARALEGEVNEMYAVVKRVSQQRDNMHRERDAAYAAARDAGAAMTAEVVDQELVRCIRCERDVPWADMDARCLRAPDAGPHEGTAPAGRRPPGWTLHVPECPHAEPIAIGTTLVDSACTCRASGCQSTRTVTDASA
jgi:hypothetical protein